MSIYGIVNQRMIFKTPLVGPEVFSWFHSSLVTSSYQPQPALVNRICDLQWPQIWWLHMSRPQQGSKILLLLKRLLRTVCCLYYDPRVIVALFQAHIEDIFVVSSPEWLTRFRDLGDNWTYLFTYCYTNICNILYCWALFVILWCSKCLCVCQLIKFLKGFNAEERVKLAKVFAYCLANGLGSSACIASLFEEHLVKDGQC